MIEGALRFGMDFLYKHYRMGHALAAFGQTCNWSRNGVKHSSVGFEFDLRGEAPYLRLYYTHETTRRMDYKIRLVKTKPHYGGERWWFVCPFTGKRCGVLYSPAGQPYFASRKVFGLSYTCQRENAWDRALRRYQKKQDQYGAPEWADAWFPRPKGMHMRTYQRRLAELERLDMILDARFVLEGMNLLKMDASELEALLKRR